MICPNCKAKTESGDICQTCGIDMVLFEKVSNVSVRLYNKGLEKAQQMELTKAIEYLGQAIEFDKTNHTARNLLGLCYYEIGEIGEALKHWIISSNLVKKDNYANDYILAVQSNEDTLFKKNDAIRLYNSAFMELEDDKVTTAIEYLLEAIDINPNFLEAINLLTLCYIQLDNQEEAISHIGTALKIDKNNEKAAHYNYLITGRKPKHQVSVGITPVKITTPMQPAGVSQYAGPSLHRGRGFSVVDLTHIASFLIGAVIIFVMLYFFVMPSWVGNMDTEIKNLNAELITTREDFLLSIEGYVAEIETKNAIIAQNEETMTTLREQLSVYVQSQTISEVEAKIAAADYIGAAEVLVTLDLGLVSDDNLEAVTAMRETVFFRAANELYTRGYNEYLANNYIIAQGFLTTSLRYTELIEANVTFLDDAIYFLGRIAQEQGDYETALSNFNVLVNEHAGTTIARRAAEAIVEVEGQMASAQEQVIEEVEEAE